VAVPVSSYLALAFLVLVVGLMAYFPDTRVALYVGPAFLVLTVLFYVFKLQPAPCRRVRCSRLRKS
jgi:AAT family amino acid transporter